MSVLGLRPISNTRISAGESLVQVNDRASLLRRDTDQILSYYQSEDAGRTYEAGGSDGAPSFLERPSSSASTSTFSSDSKHVSDQSTGDTSTSQHEPLTSSSQSCEPQRRRSVRSTGASDKRRVAIVERDPVHAYVTNEKTQETWPSEATHPSNSPSLLSKRGVDGSHLGSLALVAPPDAALSAYTNLTPPTSAPLIRSKDMLNDGYSSSLKGHTNMHHRSASEAVKTGITRSMSRKASRDIGIVGIAAEADSEPDQRLGFSEKDMHSPVERLSPIFQTPGSRAHSPYVPPDLPNHVPSVCDQPKSEAGSLGMQWLTTKPPLLTPTLGQSKDVNEPVVGPIVVNLTPSQVWQTSPASNANIESTRGPTNVSSLSQRTLHTPTPNFISSSYLNYQPGLHSTAGPLPSPPRHILPPSINSPPPPRPPRLHSPPPTVRSPEILAIKQALQLPESVSNFLTTKSSNINAGGDRPNLLITAVASIWGDEHGKETKPHALISDEQCGEPLKGSHFREGAFSATSASQIQSPMSPSPEPTCVDLLKTDKNETMDDLVAVVGDAINEVGLMNSSDVPPPTVLEPPHDFTYCPEGEKDPNPELRHESSWVSLRAEFARGTGGGSDDGPRHSSDSSTDRSTHSTSRTNLSNILRGKRTPSPQKQSIDYTLKRFSSLPRTPSILSVTRTSNRSSHSKEPSPSKPHSHKIRSLWPDAMHFREVLAKRGSLERAIGYAHKINELAGHDCGLADWVVTMRHKSASPRDAVNRMSISASTSAVSSRRTFGPQPRHSSHGSMTSEITFPRRADAYVATDLSSRPSDYDGTSPDALPPSLPYPSLARASSKTYGVLSPPSSTRSVPSTLSSNKSISGIGGGFFASIGRKASIKRERSGPTSPSSTTKLLSRRYPAPPPAPRPVKINSTPSVPGGPRAIPGRVSGLQSIVDSVPASADNNSSPQPQIKQSHRISIKRRPSVTPAISHVKNEVDLSFEDEVSKLADLLPHADKSVLAGYLRRSGQDILAIGQYLEDERNGTVRHD